MPRDPLSTVDVEERIKLPVVWFVIAGLVVLGFIANLTINIFASGGLSVWPFIAAVSLLLVINQASEEHGVGVPPFQAYGLFAGAFVVFFLFVALVSRINPWVVILMTLGVAGYLVRDWHLRKLKKAELERRRLAKLCVRCMSPVGSALDAHCPNCDLPVHGERLNLARLGKAIANRGQSARMRSVLARDAGKTTTASKSSRAMPQQSAYKYKRGK